MSDDLLDLHTLNYEKYRRRAYLRSADTYFFRCKWIDCDSIFDPKSYNEEDRDEWILSGLCKECQDRLFLDKFDKNGILRSLEE